MYMHAACIGFSCFFFIHTQVNDQLCKLTGVESRITSAYHPQSNGLDERFNQTLQRQLLKYIAGDEQSNWDLYLDSILFSYRISKQSSTKFSPFYLMYGRNARLPVEFKKLNVEGESNENSDEDCDLNEQAGISGLRATHVLASV